MLLLEAPSSQNHIRECSACILRQQLVPQNPTNTNPLLAWSAANAVLPSCSVDASVYAVAIWPSHTVLLHSEEGYAG